MGKRREKILFVKVRETYLPLTAEKNLDGIHFVGVVICYSIPITITIYFFNKKWIEKGFINNFHIN
jgi:hypothetical protein